MADINIERKKRSLWFWIIGLVLLAAVIYGAARIIGTEAEAGPTTEVQP